MTTDWERRAMADFERRLGRSYRATKILRRLAAWALLIAVPATMLYECWLPTYQAYRQSADDTRRKLAEHPQKD